MKEQLFKYLLNNPDYMFSSYQLARVLGGNINSIRSYLAYWRNMGYLNKEIIYKTIPTEKDAGVYYGIKL